jgi:acyl-coenzyme A synthetase/AMP-(fatty) acid ligase
VLTGATLVVPKSPLMNQIAAELRDAQATVLAAVPPLWMQLLQAPGFTAEPMPSLRILQNAGGHLAPAAVKQLCGLQPQARLFLQYGMTEVFRSTYLPPEEVDRKPGCMGRAMSGTEIMVVRDDDTLCVAGEVGELVHAGPTVTQGYWNDPARTADVYRPHPVKPDAPPVVYSGDMVRLDEDGYFHFVGRRDRMIKTLGYRVGPDEVLDVLYASDQIREGIVTALEDSERGMRIVAYVVLKENGSLTDLKKFCRAELPRYMQPNEIAALTEIPTLPNGKHDLATLRENAGATG